MTDNQNLKWYKVLDKDELPEGRVQTVVAGHKGLAMTHFEGKISALENACPHQGGPLGEGSIEKGWLRCPWHGWDFHPCTGRSPGSHEDGLETFPVEVRDDGIYVGLEVEKPHVRTVTDVMAETMVNWGVDTVFGMVGHSNLGLADALRRQEKQKKLKYFGVRHEGAAAFAASGYAKLTGRPAACLGIAGPGSTNLLTGLWDAKVDRAPILALCGQVDTQVLGPGTFQEVDLAAAFSAVAEYSQTVLHSSKHVELMNLAIKNSILKNDVAQLIFPDEIQTLPAAEEAKAGGPDGRLPVRQIAPSECAMDDAVNLLHKAKRPVIIVGHGARFNMPAITRLAENFGIPVITTFKGKGLISDKHPLGCGVLGRSGTPIASWFMNEADLLLVLGASFSNHTGIASYKPTIQVDIEAMALGKFHPVTVPVWGEISIVVNLLGQRLSEKMNNVNQTQEVANRWEIWREEKQSRLQDDRGKGVSSAAIFDALNRHVPENAVIAVDVGNNTYSFGRYFECTQQSVLMSGYLGSIGFGYPAAMGAWAASPHRPIFAITGDGGFGQYAMELTTAVKYKMPIKHILLNNCELEKISKEQRAGQWDVWQTSLHNPDFAKFAGNCGALGIRVTERAQLDEALQKIINHEGPAMLEVVSDVTLI